MIFSGIAWYYGDTYIIYIYIYIYIYRRDVIRCTISGLALRRSAIKRYKNKHHYHRIGILEIPGNEFVSLDWMDRCNCRTAFGEKSFVTAVYRALQS